MSVTQTQLLKVFRELEKRISEIDLRQGGPRGPRGAIGSTGDKGAKGEQGPQGPQGATGPQGPTGPTGRDGKDGSRGPQGPAGPAGIAGRNGADGNHGRDGLDGVGITDARIDFDGHLALQMSDGTTIDAGYIGVDSDGSITYVAGGGVPEYIKNAIEAITGGDKCQVLTKASSEDHDYLWDYRTKGVPYVDGATYCPQDMVFQDGWLMIANKETTDYPAPVPVGDPTFTLSDAQPWDPDGINNSVVYTGHLYTFTEPGYFRAFRVWVPTLSASTNYRFVAVRNPNGSNPTYTVFEEPILNENAWTALAVDTILVTAGEELLVYIDALDSGSTSDFGPEQWTKIADANGVFPAAGQYNFNQNRTTLRINKTDANSNDWSVTLSFLPNTVITLTDTVVATDFTKVRTNGAPIDQGAYWEYNISILDTGGTGVTDGNATDIFAEEPVTSPTEYKQDTAFWGPGTLPAWAGVQGFKQYDGVDQPGNDDTAFGVDIAFQPLVASPDWDFFGIPSGGGGGGGASGDYVEASNNAGSALEQPTQIQTLTQAEYDGLTPDANTLYFIVG